MLRFDALTFRVELDVSEVAAHFDSLGFCLLPTSPRFGYQAAYSLERGGLNHGLIQFGGDNVGTGVYVSIMGSASNDVRHSVLCWPASLLRADICLDFNGSSYFKTLSRDLISIAKASRLKTATVGDWIQNNDGRTLYIGSRASVFMMRLYEKYKQSGIDTNGEETIRLELEIKPAKHARIEAFKMSPLELVSSCAWAAPIYSKYLKLTDGLSMGSIKKLTDHERALAHMVKQYQSTIKKQLAICGGCVDTFFQSLTTHENWNNDND